MSASPSTGVVATFSRRLASVAVVAAATLGAGFCSDAWASTDGLAEGTGKGPGTNSSNWDRVAGGPALDSSNWDRVGGQVPGLRSSNWDSVIAAGELQVVKSSNWD